MKLTSILIILLFAFTLAACGGGGSSGPTTETPDPMPMTPSVDLGDLEVPADEYTIDAGETMNVGTGENEVTLSCSAAADCAFTVAADGTAMATTGEVTAALSAAAMQAIADRKAMEMKDADAAMQARIMGLTAAIADPDGDGTPGGDLQKGDRPTVDAVTADFGGVISSGDDKLGVDDKTADGESVKGQFGDPTAASAITGWAGTTQSKTADNVMTELVVYSNAEADKNEKYLTYFGAGNASGDNARPADVTAIDTDDNNTVKDGTLTLSGTVSEASLYGGSLFQFPATAGQSTTKSIVDDAETTTVNENEIGGTFAGVSGTFVCDGTCTAVGNSKGVLTSLTGTWTFRPDGTASNLTVSGVIKDVDYLAFGYWLETTTKTDGSMTYGVNTFAAGRQTYDHTDAENLEGTATYNGDATGLYALKDFSTGAGVPSEAGQFTADARLTANFGGTSVAEDDQFHISGQITNFRDTDNQPISGGAWTATLNRNTDNFALGTSTTVGGSTTGDGSWTGTFFGNGAATDNADTDVDDRAPTGISGEFNAHFGNGHVVGAFGATR